ncbi:MAG: DUF4426 domain-containing protein [Gammaproteobacteria bacterium]|nr:DUF4426 domain-containing protein [Gammaproteobacteria bacterium]
MHMYSLSKCLMVASVLFLSPCSFAEQKVVFGEYEIHYIVIPTTFLDSSVANQYNLVRGNDRALVNISILNAESKGVQAVVTGTSKNLIGQIQTLSFAEVKEQQAIYYLAQLRHADEEHHRLEISIQLPNGKTAHLDFRQKMYWER